MAREFVVAAVVVAVVLVAEGFCLVTMELAVGTGGGSLRVRPLPGAEDPRLLAAADEGRGFTADIIMGMAVYYFPPAGGDGKRERGLVIKRGTSPLLAVWACRCYL